MVRCSKCGSRRVASITAKCSDLFSEVIDDKEVEGYVPRIEIYCMDCGQIQGKGPIPSIPLDEVATHVVAQTQWWWCVDPRHGEPCPNGGSLVQRGCTACIAECDSKAMFYGSWIAAVAKLAARRKSKADG